MTIAMYWMDRILWIRLLASLELLLMIDGFSTTTTHVSGNEGSEVTLLCNIDDGPDGYVVWRFHATSDNDRVYIAAVSKSGVFIPDRTTAWANDISSTGTSLVIHRLRLDRDEGYFRCSSGVESITIKVTVLVPVRTVALNPAGTVTLRTTQVDATTFTCTAASKPVAAVTWKRVYATGAVILSGATARETSIGDLTQVISSLSYTPQKEHNGDKIRCSAINIAMTSPVVSSDANLIIYYPPDYVRAISGYTNPVTESRIECLHLTCSANGVPNPNTLIYTWSNGCRTGVRNGSQISVPRSRTMNNKQCYCTVTHSETGWNQNSPHVEFKITYTPDVTVCVNRTHVTEGDSTQLECHPSAVPDIYTYIAWTQHMNGVKVRQFTGSRLLSLNNLTFENSGEYRCTVNNSVGTGTGSGIVTMKYASKLVEVGNFSDGLNATATLSLKFIGDPQPNVTWYKDGSNSSLAAKVIKFTITIVPINVSWIFYKTPVTIPGYEATLTIHSVQEQDYSAYHATLDNGLKTYSLVPRFSVHLMRNDKPEHPSAFDTVCAVTTAVISWTSQFNGGLTQTFHLSYFNDGHTVHLSKQVPGKDKTGTIEMNPLQAGKNYIFHIFARNNLGDSETVSTCCQTKQNIVSTQAQESVDNINEVAIAACVAVPLAIIIAVVAVVVIARLRRRKNSDANKRPLYADVDTRKNNITLVGTGPLYVDVDKSKQNKTLVHQGPLYADVDKRKNNNTLVGTGPLYVDVDKSKQNKTLVHQGPLYADVDKRKNNNTLVGTGPLYVDVDKSKQNKTLVHPGPLYADVDKRKNNNTLVGTGPLYVDVDKSKQNKTLVHPGIDCEDVAMTGTDRTVNNDTSNEICENTENEAKKQNPMLVDVAYETVGELQQRIQEQQSQAPPPHAQGVIYADLALVDVKENKLPRSSGRLQVPAGNPKPPTTPVKPVSVTWKEEATVYASIDHIKS